MRGITLQILLLALIVTAQKQIDSKPVFTICGTIRNYKPGKSIYMALYTSNENFKAQKHYKTLRFPKDQLPPDSVDYCFSDIGAGEYMIVCFQDTDDNGHLNYGLFGRPSEPYCFFRPFKGMFRPGFNDCKFTVGSSVYNADLRF